MERQSDISLGMQPCLSISFSDIKSKDLHKLWGDYFKKFGKFKYNRKAKEYFVNGARISSIKSGDPIDVYVKYEDFTDGSRIDVTFDITTGFLSSRENPTEYRAAERFLNEFELFVEKYKLEELLKEEEKNLDRLTRDLRKAVSDNDKLLKSITDYEERIAKAEKDIKDNEVLQSDLEKQIEDQNKKVNSVRAEYNKISK
jgi:molecular chaperone DnaK (HSP70)